MLLQLRRVSAIVIAGIALASLLYVYRTIGTRTSAAWMAKPNTGIAVTRYPTATERPNTAIAAGAVPFGRTAEPISTPSGLQVQPTLPVPVDVAIPPAAQLDHIRHQQQTWNNCGPATLSMLMSYFDFPDTQQVIGAVLKPYKDDKNVSPDALISYAQGAGMQAKLIVGGDVALLKRLVANGFPVIVESWFIPEPGDEMGHYQLVVGYDGDTLNFFDSYHGPNIQHSVTEFDGLWRVFNRLAIVVWRAEQADQMRELIGPRWDDTQMTALALADAQRDVAANPRDKFGWFNLGSTLLRQGDNAGAAEAYDHAIDLKLPWRMLWYQFGPYEAYFAQRQNDKLLKLANTTLKVKAGLEESYYWRGRAYAALGKPQSARDDFKQALVYRANYAEAQAALETLH